MLREKKYTQAGFIYEYLANSGYEEGLRAAIDGAKEMMKNGRYTIAANIYQILAEYEGGGVKRLIECV